MSAPRSPPPTGSQLAPATGRCIIFMPGGDGGSDDLLPIVGICADGRTQLP
jgi:hypothetical protein